MGKPQEIVVVPVVRRTRSPRRLMTISAARFRTLKAARQTIREALNIERNYWARVDNFRDYESELLQLPLSKALSHSVDWEEVQEENAMVDRRVLNLLASARAYLDQLNTIC